jgi:hypothetical protein
MTTTETRRGRCFELAAKHVLDEGGILVHGTIWNPYFTQNIVHAWVEHPRRTHGRYAPGPRDIWEPILAKTFSADDYSRLFLPVTIDRYDRRPVVYLLAHYGHWGPWTPEAWDAGVGFTAPGATRPTA